MKELYSVIPDLFRNPVFSMVSVIARHEAIQRFYVLSFLRRQESSVSRSSRTDSSFVRMTEMQIIQYYS